MRSGSGAGARGSRHDNPPLVRHESRRILPAMIRRHILACAVATVAILSLACSGGDDDSTVGTPVPETPEAIPTYSGPTTGIAAIDEVVGPAVTGDVIRLAAITGYTQAACAKEPSGDAPPPACRVNESEGTEVEVLPSLGCGRDWIRPEQVPDIYREALEGDPREFRMAFAPVAGVRGIEAEFVAIVSTSATDVAGFFIRDGRVVAVEQPCDGDAVPMTAPERIALQIFPAP